MVIRKTTTELGFTVKLRFTLTQHSRDRNLMNNIKNFLVGVPPRRSSPSALARAGLVKRKGPNLAGGLGCGYIYDNSQNPAVYLDITKYSDVLGIIIPLFNKYTLEGQKRLDFQAFCKVADLMKDKAHLTHEGLSQIQEIQRFINKGRNPSES